MSFSDPTTFTGVFNGTYGAPTGGTDLTFVRQAEGRYISSNQGTADEPVLWIVNSSYQPQGMSVFTHRMNISKNVPAVNGVAQADDVLAISVQIKVPHKSFAVADVQRYIKALCGPLATNANSIVDKTLRGER